MKKFLKVSLIAPGIAVLLFATLWFFFISPPRIIFQIGLPEIAKNLPSNFTDADQEFNQRVQTRYDDGIDTVELTNQLNKEGFDVTTEGTAQVTRSKFPCTLTWRITWTNDIATKATNITGSYGDSCL